MTTRGIARACPVLLVSLAACFPPAPPPPLPPPPAEPLPELPMTAALTPRPERADRAPRDGRLLDFMPPGEPITLQAQDADVRALLIAFADAAGINMVLDPEIAGRVTVNLVEVPVRDAIEAVLAQAGLGIAPDVVEPPLGPVVFYVLPVDVDEASAELIAARFDVSLELARVIVVNRIP